MATTAAQLTPASVPVPDGTSILARGARAANLLVPIEGWILRFAQTADGRRQITELFLPGDLCDPLLLHHGAVQHYRAAGQLRHRGLARAELAAAAARDGRIETALWSLAAAHSARSANRMLAVSRRSALERVALLACEVHARLEHAGRADACGCEWRLDHEGIADCTGLTAIQAARMVGELKVLGLAAVGKDTLQIRDFQRLAAFAGFDRGAILVDQAATASQELARLLG